MILPKTVCLVVDVFFDSFCPQAKAQMSFPMERIFRSPSFWHIPIDVPSCTTRTPGALYYHFLQLQTVVAVCSILRKKKRSGPGPLMFMFLRRRGENVSTKHNLLSLLFITKLSQLIKKDWIGTFVFFWLITIAFSIVVIENQ